MCVGGEVDARGPPSLSILLFQVLFIFQIVCICLCEDMCPEVQLPSEVRGTRSL